MRVVRNAVDLMNDYGNENWLQRVINDGTAHDGFEQVNKELMQAVQELELDIMIEVSHIF